MVGGEEMICSICNGIVEWQGKLTNLSHTKCLCCGAINAQVTDIDNPDIDMATNLIHEKMSAAIDQTNKEVTK
jgi:Fe2+ or Zn2+ uptake regulation protein